MRGKLGIGHRAWGMGYRAWGMGHGVLGMGHRARGLYVRLRFACIVFYLMMTSPVFAQKYQVRVDAAFDTSQIKIGEQFHLNLDVMLPAGTKIAFPSFGDSIGKIDIIDRSAIDTLTDEDGKYVTYKQSLTLTAFDPGNYILQPFFFYYQTKGSTKTDSVATPVLMLQVQTIAVDTTKAIKDIKPPMEVPVTFDEILPYIIAAILLIVITLLIIRYLKKRKLRSAKVEIIKEVKPAHDIAIEELQRIESQKLWQQGYYKQYQSEVSDTIRLYIENRFNIPAPELTSHETLSHIRKLAKTDASEKLKYILSLADTVKFAKAVPIETENLLALEYAFNFISLTKRTNNADTNTRQQEEKEVSS